MKTGIPQEAANRFDPQDNCYLQKKKKRVSFIPSTGMCSGGNAACVGSVHQMASAPHEFLCPGAGGASKAQLVSPRAGWHHPSGHSQPSSLLSPPEKPGTDTGGPRLLERARRHAQSRTDQGDHSTHRAQKQLPGFAERAPGTPAPRRSSSLCSAGFRCCWVVPSLEVPKAGLDGAGSTLGWWNGVWGRPG